MEPFGIALFYCSVLISAEWWGCCWSSLPCLKCDSRCLVTVTLHDMLFPFSVTVNVKPKMYKYMFNAISLAQTWHALSRIFLWIMLHCVQLQYLVLIKTRNNQLRENHEISQFLYHRSKFGFSANRVAPCWLLNSINFWVIWNFLFSCNL